MFIFAIIFFGVLTDAGMFDPIINGILRLVKNHPERITVGAAVPPRPWQCRKSLEWIRRWSTSMAGPLPWDTL
jgi:hypothetical protein